MGGLGIYNGFTPEERDQAGRWKKQAAKQGLYHYPTKCLACGQTEGAIDGHWEDYSPPFSEDTDIPLCRRCHLMVHVRLKQSSAWKAYRELIKAGWQGPPIRNQMRWEDLLTVPGVRDVKPTGWVRVRTDQRNSTILDVIDSGKLCPPGRVPGNAPA